MRTTTVVWRRMTVVIALAVGIAGSVVIGLEKNNACAVEIPPNNQTAWAATSVCGQASAAQYVSLVNATTASRIVVHGGFQYSSKGAPKTAPDGIVGNFTVQFRANVSDLDGDFPGAALPVSPVGGGAPIGPRLIVPGNSTKTGRFINNAVGLLQERRIDLNIPDVFLPVGPFWVEIFQSSAPPGNKTCDVWKWQTGTPGNATDAFALDPKAAPGSLWEPVPGALALKIFTATGACCTDEPGRASECVETTRPDCVNSRGLFVGEGSACTQDFDCLVLLVEFESVSVQAVADGVRIDWTTTVEIDTVGFRILREASERGAKSVELVSPLIHAVGAGLTGGSYSFLDNSAGAVEARQYYIEDLDIYGRWTRHGPFPVQRFREAPVRGDARTSRQR